MVDSVAGKIAIPSPATTAYTAKQPMKSKTESVKRESKRVSDHERNKTHININGAFPKGRGLRDHIELKLD